MLKGRGPRWTSLRLPFLAGRLELSRSRWRGFLSLGMPLVFHMACRQMPERSHPQGLRSSYFTGDFTFVVVPTVYSWQPLFCCLNLKNG